MCRTLPGSRRSTRHCTNAATSPYTFSAAFRSTAPRRSRCAADRNEPAAACRTGSGTGQPVISRRQSSKGLRGDDENAGRHSAFQGLLRLLGRRHVADLGERTPVVEPVHPFESDELDGLAAPPRPTVLNSLGLVDAGHGLGQGVVQRIADATDRRFDAVRGQPCRVPDQEVLHAPVAMVNEPLMRQRGVARLLDPVDGQIWRRGVPLEGKTAASPTLASEARRAGSSAARTTFVGYCLQATVQPGLQLSCVLVLWASTAAKALRWLVSVAVLDSRGSSAQRVALTRRPFGLPTPRPVRSVEGVGVVPPSTVSRGMVFPPHRPFRFSSSSRASSSEMSLAHPYAAATAASTASCAFASHCGRSL